MARGVRYTVTFGILCDMGSTMCQSKPRVMDSATLEFALAMADPFNYVKWMADVRALRRSGDTAVITSMSASGTRGDVARAIHVRRV